jgi:5-methylcytosine-specific restriction endonuclease McrA
MSEYELDGENDSVECPTCGDAFADNSWLGRHHKSEHGETLDEWKARQGDYQCPRDGCQRGFESKHALNTHYGRFHDGSIAGVEITCEWCGETTRRRRDVAEESERSFCSYECRDEWQRENFVGEGNPAWDAVAVVCEVCGDEYYTPQHTKDSTRYCSVPCRRIGHAQTISGTGNGNWKPNAYIDCKQCEETFGVWPSIIDLRKFCSWECKKQWEDENWIGEDHPNYQGGPSPQLVGSAWFSAGGPREQALERDSYECQVCGMTNEEHERTVGQALDVHHIRPRQAFVDDGVYDEERGDRLSILITMCRECHARWEDVQLRPMRGGD